MKECIRIMISKCKSQYSNWSLLAPYDTQILHIHIHKTLQGQQNRWDNERNKYIPHLLEAYFIICFRKVAFSKGKNSVPHLKKSHSAIPDFFMCINWWELYMSWIRVCSVKHKTIKCLVTYPPTWLEAALLLAYNNFFCFQSNLTKFGPWSSRI